MPVPCLAPRGSPARARWRRASPCRPAREQPGIGAGDEARPEPLQIKLQMPGDRRRQLVVQVDRVLDHAPPARGSPRGARHGRPRGGSDADRAAGRRSWRCAAARTAKARSQPPPGPPALRRSRRCRCAGPRESAASETRGGDHEPQDRRAGAGAPGSSRSCRGAAAPPSCRAARPPCGRRPAARRRTSRPCAGCRRSRPHRRWACRRCGRGRTVSAWRTCAGRTR